MSIKKITQKHRGILCLSAVMYLICAGIDTVFAIVMGNIVDSSVDLQMHKLLVSTAISMGLVVGSLLFEWLAIVTQRGYVMRCVTELKASLMQSFFRRELPAFHKESNSYYLNILSNDVDLVENDYLLKKPLLPYLAGQFLFSVAALFYLSWKATLFFFLLFLLPIFVPQLLDRILAKRKAALSVANEDFTFELKEQIQGMSDIVTCLSIPAFFKKFTHANQAQQKAKKAAGETESFVQIAAGVCGFVAQLGCMAIGGIFVIRGELRIGELIAAVQLLNSVFSPITRFSSTLACMSGSRPVREKVDAELQAELPPAASAEPALSGEIRFQKLSVAYTPEKPVLQNFDHTFSEGKTYAVIGSSGSGKTTLMNCLLKIYEDYTGNIFIGDRDIRNLPAADVYQYIGLVPQNPYLFNDTLSQNITLGGDYSEEEQSAVIDRVCLRKFASASREELGDSGANISGGEKQRIALARALLRRPKVLVFDEPTAALDPSTRDSINELIFSLDGYTRIVITHDLRDEYLSHFDEVVSLEGNPNGPSQGAHNRLTMLASESDSQEVPCPDQGAACPQYCQNENFEKTDELASGTLLSPDTVPR